MAEFLTTNAISFYIENIIKDAKSELYLLMPYLQLSREFYETLKASSDRAVSIIIVYANEDLYTEEKIKLGELENLEIYNLENLNVKCCCNEENVLITSMDLHQMSVIDNVDMGVLFNKISDIDLYKKTYYEIKTIITSSKNMNLHKKPIEELAQPSVKLKKIYHGFCIKCAMPISYNINNPYCKICAPETNSEYDNVNDSKYCHICGSLSSTKGGSPICEVCKIEY